MRETDTQRQTHRDRHTETDTQRAGVKAIQQSTAPLAPPGLSLCLSVSLFFCLSVGLLACLPACLSVTLSVCDSVCLSQPLG